MMWSTYVPVSLAWLLLEQNWDVAVTIAEAIAEASSPTSSSGKGKPNTHT